MTNTNSIGDKGSPWRSPRAWWILLHGLPFNSIFMLNVDIRLEIHSCHRLLKPICWRTSSKKGQDTKSKALVISILLKKQLTFLTWMHMPLWRRFGSSRSVTPHPIMTWSFTPSLGSSSIIYFDLENLHVHKTEFSGLCHVPADSPMHSRTVHKNMAIDLAISTDIVSPGLSDDLTRTVHQITSCTYVSCPQLDTSVPTCQDTCPMCTSWKPNTISHSLTLPLSHSHSVSSSSFLFSLELTQEHKEKEKGIDWRPWPAKPWRSTPRRPQDIEDWTRWIPLSLATRSLERGFQEEGDQGKERWI